jgi:membrane-bound metal-dependent hydrolase YbcI (DUF457 family)
MLLMTMLPDLESDVRVLRRRGFSHTIVFAVVTGGAVLGVIALLVHVFGVGVAAVTGFVPSFIQPTVTGALFGIGTVLGIVSHIIGDVVVDGEGKPSLRPFWPFGRTPVQLGVLSQNHKWANEGLLQLMIVLMLLSLSLRSGIRPGYLF